MLLRTTRLFFNLLLLLLLLHLPAETLQLFDTFLSEVCAFKLIGEVCITNQQPSTQQYHCTTKMQRKQQLKLHETNIDVKILPLSSSTNSTCRCRYFTGMV